ncbi:uncharacterized protein EV154DRAFT_538450 [Mucor mucedo]|uniref:uncharacterized protein n=1 Tax=Mucor mucedo TaxID=29922 RepID=UPI00222125E1|nr:uncharacterized protein EV154DRAFT_538450 [Mucor mucedo]KAI7890334.1 hypothetical protein EV154DRAFT_538450 [Mucor mucedo]
MTRFWKRAGVREEKDSITVVLDKRNLRTPSKNVVQFPVKQRELALLTAAEWDAQTKNLKAHTLPLTSIVARAIDAFDPAHAEDLTVRGAVIDKLMVYFDTDAICYHEEFPEILTELQDKYWKPILDWTRNEFDVQINTTTDIFAITQPDETKAKFRAIIDQMGPLELSAFEKAVLSSKSFLIGFALVHQGISVEHAACAAQVEMNAQMDRWGEVEDSHDVEREYIRQTLGSVAIALMDKHQG